jgi:nickel/cobalt transporter (NicO) family protein
MKMKRVFLGMRDRRLRSGVVTELAYRLVFLAWAWTIIGIGPDLQADPLHPVPRRAHDRTIIVRLGPDKVTVDYRLEVDEFTVVFEDLPAFSDQIDLTRLSKPDEFYEAFVRCYAPVLAGNLVASVDGKPLTFTWGTPRYTLRDQLGQKLGHLRCDFRFEARTGIETDQSLRALTQPGSPSPSLPQAEHEFRFRESNYELEEGRIRLSFVSLKGVRLQKKVEPDLKLQETPPSELKPGDDGKLRTITATFVISESPTAPGVDATRRSESPGATRVAPPDAVAPSPSLPFSPSPIGGDSAEGSSLLELLLDPQRGIWVLLVLAGFFGAVHALAPGHGKTLVAAYLVGEHGTVWHALILGLVTTLTHTGAVIALAGILLIVNPEHLPNLEFFGGLLVAGMGLWLLLRRLAGQADHFHLGSHGHGHHHEHMHRESKIEDGGSKGETARTHNLHSSILHPQPTSTVGGWWGLIALGISGGIVPCYDAIIMLIFAVSARRLWLALPLLLAFSAGLAGVLIVIGILVVQVKGFASSRFGMSRWVKSLPLVSAVLVIVLGMFLCYRSVHPTSNASSRPAATATLNLDRERQ